LRAALALLCLGLALPAAALDVPPSNWRVTDLAGLLSPSAVQELEQQLEGYETRTGHQFLVLIVPSLEGEALEDYSLRVAESWKLGSAGRDDGLLLLISVGDRKARIEVGHGLEGAITDALSSRILRGTLGPPLAAGHAEAGIRASLEQLMRAAEQEATGRNSSPVPPALFVLLWIAFLILAVQLDRARRRALAENHHWGRRRRDRSHVWIEPPGWGGGFGGMGQHGGGFGGGGGGFRGGGGSFGGGGASGSW
jgi:uncharacterized protein